MVPGQTQDHLRAIIWGEGEAKLINRNNDMHEVERCRLADQTGCARDHKVKIHGLVSDDIEGKIRRVLCTIKASQLLKKLCL